MLIQHKLFESRSTLYNLKPIGINTDEIESLTSYVTRLSTAHNVTLGVLFNELIYPILRKESRPRDGVTVFDTIKLPKVDGIACPELVDYNVHIYIRNISTFLIL
ncbi:hypothetical protein [Cytobacillus gottheilii]|uniref:hypothetical protein n=1 Tax=Cytobacillus gottheilii TaxID=859144 RepID=UPI00082C5F97|nr:hypothetical protein [Cytobacillus gottheilii]